MNIDEAPLLLPVLLDVGSVAGSTQLLLAAVWSTSGARGSKGSGSAGWTHAQRDKPLGNTALGRHSMHQGPPEGRRAASLSQGGGGQAVLARSSGDSFLQGCFQVYLSSRSRMLFSPAVTMLLHTGPLVMAGHGTMPSQQCRGVLMLNLNHQADQLLSCMANIFTCLAILSRAAPVPGDCGFSGP